MDFKKRIEKKTRFDNKNKVQKKTSLVLSENIG